MEAKKANSYSLLLACLYNFLNDTVPLPEVYLVRNNSSNFKELFYGQCNPDQLYPVIRLINTKLAQSEKK